MARASTARISPTRRARASAPAQPLEYRILLTATLCLLAAGAVMVYSASSARALLAGHGGSGYLGRCVAFGAIGLVVMQVLARSSLDWTRRATPLLLVAGFAGALAVLIPGLGIEVNGARRWLGGGALKFQPSELLKLGVVL